MHLPGKAKFRASLLRKLKIASALLVFILPASSANVRAAGDPAEGERLARQWCAACHVVADDQESGTEAVPSFTEIAETRGFSEATLAGFLADPHPKMPDMNLTNREISNLTSYILSRGK